MTGLREWFATGNEQIVVQNRIALLERAPTRSKPASDQGHGVRRFFLEGHQLELHQAQMNVKVLGSMIKGQGSRTSFESVLVKETTPCLPAAHSLLLSGGANSRL